MLKNEMDELLDIASLSAQIEVLFAQEDFETLMNITQQRQQRLEAFFSRPIPAKESEKVAEIIQKILDTDAVVKDKLVQLRQAALGEIIRLGKSQKASSAYKNTQNHSC